ncbi:MAG: RedB protein [Planctomycetota bacterium]
MNSYATTPGHAGDVVAAWPKQSAIATPSAAFSAVLFAHPDCPCTQATLTNLRQLSGRHGDRFDLKIVFFDTAGRHDEWAQTRLKEMAGQIPGARVALDSDGAEARLFGVRTSGYVVVFDREEKVVFSGGVTASRGHAGASPGLDAIESLLINDTAPSVGRPAEAAVYGCPLGCALNR